MRVCLNFLVCGHLLCGDRKLIHTPYGRTCLSIQCFPGHVTSFWRKPCCPHFEDEQTELRDVQQFVQDFTAETWPGIEPGWWGPGLGTYLNRIPPQNGSLFLFHESLPGLVWACTVNPLYLPGIGYQEVWLSHRRLHLCLPHPTKVQRFQRLGWAGVRGPTPLCSTMVWHFIFITNGALFLSPTAPLHPWAHWPFFRGKVRHTFGWKWHQ